MNKRIFMIVIMLIIVAIVIPVTIKIINKNQEEIKVISQEELNEAYYTQNSVFLLLVNRGIGKEEREKSFRYMPANLEEPHINGVECVTYEYLALYRKETGNSLTYDQVIDYLSQEFEGDGEVRIYINGRHPEILTYIEWFEKNSGIRNSYIARAREIYIEYADEHEDFPRCSLNLIPTEMIDELIKKEADPNYNLDLKTIQDRYIAEGKAKVSEDGKTIEYIVPEK